MIKYSRPLKESEILESPSTSQTKAVGPAGKQVVLPPGINREFAEFIEFTEPTSNQRQLEIACPLDLQRRQTFGGKSEEIHRGKDKIEAQV